MRRIIFTSAAAAAAITLAACASSIPTQPAAGGSQSTPAASSAQTASRAAVWHLGGAFAGPWPPVGLGPWGPQVSTAYHNDLGYRYRDFVKFGPPLHFGIPYEGFGCGVNAGVVQDLPPGEYTVPFTVISNNRLTQQELSSWASVTFTGSGANPTLTDERLPEMTRSDGSCVAASAVIMAPHGSAEAYGLIGPLSANDLRSLCVTVGPELLSTGDAPQTLPLINLVPGQRMPGGGSPPSC
jgi:hypothetical protein